MARLRWYFLVGVSLLYSTLALGAQPEQAPWRVLVLRGTALFSASDMIYDVAMRDAITSATDRLVEFHGEPLDVVRFSGTEFEQELMAFLRKKYRDTKFDLIVAAGPGALDFAARNRNALWPETPVVFYSVLAESLEGKRLPPDFTGLTLGLDPAGTIDLAMLLQPGARRIVVVAGKGAYDKNWIGRVRPLVERHRGRLDVEYLDRRAIARNSGPRKQAAGGHHRAVPQHVARRPEPATRDAGGGEGTGTGIERARIWLF